MDTKKWYHSRTLWVNTIAGIAGIVQAVTGTGIIDPEMQVGLLVIVNIILRFVTNVGIEA